MTSDLVNVIKRTVDVEPLNVLNLPLLHPKMPHKQEPVQI